MSLFNFSCGGSAEKSDSTEKDDFPYRAAKTDVKTDGQLYTDGFLNMPSYLWTERKTKDYGELDKGTAKGIFAVAKHKNGFILVKDSRGYRSVSFTKTADPINICPSISAQNFSD